MSHNRVHREKPNTFSTTRKLTPFCFFTAAARRKYIQHLIARTSNAITEIKTKIIRPFSPHNQFWALWLREISAPQNLPHLRNFSSGKEVDQGRRNPSSTARNDITKGNTQSFVFDCITECFCFVFAQKLLSKSITLRTGWARHWSAKDACSAEVRCARARASRPDLPPPQTPAAAGKPQTQAHLLAKC
jgi:hypothetical protein